MREQKMNIKIINGDITKLHVDAIVNAANRTLFGGGGVDGAIHRAAGEKLLDECIKIRKEKYVKGLPTGEAVITSGFDLPSKHIIHTVGPIYGEDDISLLEKCYENSLNIADEHKLESIAFPSISTGAYDVPISLAVEIVHSVLCKYKSKNIKEITLVLHSDADYNVYIKKFKNSNLNI